MHVTDKALFSSLYFWSPTLQTLPFTSTAGNIPTSQTQPEAGIPGHPVTWLSTQAGRSWPGGQRDVTATSPGPRRHGPASA